MFSDEMQGGTMGITGFPRIIASGYEYEVFLCEYLQNAGFSCKQTRISGDQGVDLIVESGGKRIAVQCKLYSSPVGNEAVQQVASGRAFYKCNVACVVTNSTYTAAAKTLATKLKVKLLHHKKLLEYICSFDQLKSGGSKTANQLKRASANGDVAATEQLGLMYANGWLVRRSDAMARKWLSLALLQAHNRIGLRGIRKTSCGLLARLLAEGRGGVQDIKSAIRLCKKAGLDEMLRNFKKQFAQAKREVSSVFQIRCPKCSSILETTKSVCIGAHIKCMGCGNRFTYG